MNARPGQDKAHRGGHVQKDYHVLIGCHSHKGLEGVVHLAALQEGYGLGACSLPLASGSGQCSPHPGHTHLLQRPGTWSDPRVTRHPAVPCGWRCWVPASGSRLPPRLLRSPRQGVPCARGEWRPGRMSMLCPCQCKVLLTRGTLPSAHQHDSWHQERLQDNSISIMLQGAP